MDRLLKDKKNFSLKGEGFSMLPILKPGDVLYIKKVSYMHCYVNDILMVKKRRRVFTHRVIYKNVNYLITKGDNNRKSDGKIFPSQMIGKVYQIKQNGDIIDLDNFYLLQSTLYFHEIVKVKKAFEKGKIDYVFLKGLPLHLYFEKSHPRRMYADCDVLIGVEDFRKVGKLLKSFGYREIDTTLSDMHKRLKNKITEVSYYKLINNFPVVFDVHLEVSFLINQFGRLEALYPEKLVKEISSRFLQEKNEVKIHASTFPLLSHKNLIFYLALHFFHHNYRSAYRLELLDTVIRRSLQIPSPRGSTSHTPEVFLSLHKTIKAYRLQNFVYPVFLLLKKYYGTPLRQNFLRSIEPNDDKLRYIKKNILNKNIFDDESRMEAGVNRFQNLFHLSSEPLYKKMLIFITPSVLYSIFWVTVRKFISPGKLFSLKLNPSKVH